MEKPFPPENDPLRVAVFQAEQQLRYFMRRDEMNAEVHLNLPIGLAVPDSRVRYSPITYAAQSVVSYLWDQLYEERPLPLIPGLR